MSGKASSYNLGLIAAYRKHPSLYDNRHRDYKVQNPTKEAWINVASLCHSTPDECRSRWKALRDRFIKERKKRNSNANYKVAWPLYNKMSFLEPFIENTFLRNKKEIRSGFSRLPNSNLDVSRKTIDNVVELLVREASTSMGRNRSALNGHSHDGDIVSMVSVAKPLDTVEHSIPEDGNELEQFYLKLIREVKKHQLLFDSSSSLYRVASARNRVWDEIASSFESYGDGYSAHELRTKWRSIRDRYIRERRLYKESLQEGIPKFPKWPLYTEFSFLDFYVDQTMPRTYHTAENNNDNESIHSNSAGHDEDNLMSSFNLSHDNEEADQSSPSSSSSTPSSNAAPNQPNISVLQILQRLMQNSDSNNHHTRWQSTENSSADTNSVILKNLSLLMQNPNFRLRNNSTTPISSLSDGITEVLGELNRTVTKLANLSNEISENGLEHSFGQYVTNELIRTPEPRRSELRREILTLLNDTKFKPTNSH